MQEDRGKNLIDQYQNNSRDQHVHILFAHLLIYLYTLRFLSWLGFGHYMKDIYPLFLIQLGITAIAAIAWALLLGRQAGVSVLAAAMCCIVPNFLLANRLFAYSGARSAAKIIKSFYRGEILKIIATVVLFVLCIKYGHILFLPFMATYVLCQMAFWVMPWLGSKHKVKSA